MAAGRGGASGEVQQPQTWIASYSQAITPQAITLTGAVVNVVLALIKFVGGTLSGSPALLADAYHSLSDLLSDGLCMFATAVPSLERVCIIGIGALITFAGGTMLHTALQEIWTGSWAISAAPRVATGAALMIAFISVASKEALFRVTRAVGLRSNSQLLMANAHHHRSDAFSSVAAVFGLLGSICGFAIADSAAAALVGAMILKMGLETTVADCATAH